MLLDELPIAFDDDHVAEAVAIATNTEASFDNVDGFGRQLRQIGEQHGGAPGQLLVVEGLICGYVMAAPEQESSTGFLAPSVEWTSGATFPPPPDRFPDGVRPYVENRANETAIPQLSARYHDFVWIRWKDHWSGRAARSAYVLAARDAELSDASVAIASMQHLARAAELALTFDDEPDATRDVIFGEVRRGLAADSLGHACSLAERTARLLASDTVHARRLAQEFIDTAETARVAEQHHRERSYLETAEALGRASRDEALTAMCRERLALSFEAEAATATSGMVAQHWYAEALKAYRDLGRSADVERLKPMMRQASERMVTEMKPISGGPLTVPHEAIDRTATATSVDAQRSPAAMLALPDELGLWPAWESIADETRRSMSAHPLTSLMPMVTVEADARAQPEPDDETERELARQIRTFSQRTVILVGLSSMVVDRLRDRGVWREESLTDALALAGGDISDSAASGIRHYEQGDYWSAVHVLVPQIERSVRHLGRLVGGEIERLTGGGGFRWASLDGLLTDARIRAALGQSLALELEALLVSPYGRNLRNNVAHGTLEESVDHQHAALLAVFILLSIASRIILAVQGSSTSTSDERLDT